MENLMGTITTLITNGVAAITIAISFATFVLQTRQLQNTRKMKSAEKRICDIIFPIFLIIEPYMKSGAPLACEDAAKILEILDHNAPFIGNLYDYQELLSDCCHPHKSVSHLKELDQFYSTVNKELDANSKAIGIPPRSIRYRYKNYRFVFVRFLLVTTLVDSVTIIFMGVCAALFMFNFISFPQTGVIFSRPLITFFVIFLFFVTIDRLLFYLLDR